MAFALVGSAGAATQGVAGAAVTPAWDAGASRTAGNLLLLFLSNTGTNGTPGASFTSGGLWFQITPGSIGSGCSAAIYWKIAAGGDAAPTVPALASAIYSAHLEEWSGNSSSQPDKKGTASGTIPPITATLSAVDTAAGDLVVMVGTDKRSTARASVNTWTSNNGTPTLRASNNGVSSLNHYSHATMITTGNAAADTAVMTLSITTSITGLAVAAASFNPGAGAVTHEAAAAINALATLAGDADVRSAVPYNRRNRMQELVAQ